MDRRAFISGATLGLLAGPLDAGAQEGRKVPRIGVLWPNPPATFDWFRRGLSDLGYTEGRNVNFEYRWAEGRLGQLPELAAELVRLKVDVIVALAPPARRQPEMRLRRSRLFSSRSVIRSQVDS
jgi:putative ABC transport system substrate-binding protein